VFKGDPVLLKIDRIRRSVILWTMGWGYLWVALAVMAAVFGGVLLDHALVLQKWGRIAFSRAFVASLGAALLMASLFPLVKRIGRLYIARRMESERPGLKNALISYLQCRDDPETPGELKLLLGRKAARHIHSLDSHVAVDRARYVRLAAAVCGVLVLFLAYSVLSPKSSFVSVRRLFWPRADIHPPTATRLSQIDPGDMYLIQGDEPRLKVRAEGARPQSACAIWDGTSFEGRRILLSETSDGLWEGQFPPVLEDGSYYVAAGDTRSDRFQIRALPRPVVERVQLTLRPPAYTGLPVQRLDGGDADVISGTEVFVRALTNLPPGRGYLQFDSGRRVWMHVVEDGSALQAALTALRSDAYSVHFETARYPNGSSFQNLAPVKFRLTVREDEAPTITLHGPPDGVELRPDQAARIAYSARDDLAVTAVRIRFSIGGVARPPVTILEPHVSRVDSAEHAWELASIPAPAGSVITYSLEAQDSRPQAANVGRTETRRIVVLGAAQADQEEARPRSPEAQAAEGERSEGAEGEGERAPAPEAEQREREDGQPAEPADSDRPDDAAATAAPERTLPDSAEAGDERAGDELEEQARRVAELLERERGATEEGTSGESGETGERTASAPEPSSGGQASEQGGEAQEQGAASEGGGPASEEVPGEAGQADSEGGAEAGSEAQESAGDEPAAGQAAEGEGTGEDQARGGAAEASGEAGDRPSAAAEPGQAEPAEEQAAASSGGGPGGRGRGTGGAGEEQGASEAEGEAAAEAGDAPQAGSQGGGEGASSGAAPEGGQAGSGAGDARSGQLPAGQTAGGEGRGAADGEPADQSTAGSTPGAGPQGTGVSELPPDGAPEGALPVQDLDRAMEELARLLDEDRVPPRVLAELGMDRQELRRFVDRYEETRAERESPSTGPQVPPPAQEGRVIEASGPAAQDMAVRDALPGEPERDSLRSRFEGASDRLSLRYREVVNRYYEALSEEQ